MHTQVTLLFVHGTGVRGRGYASTLKQIERNVSSRGWSATVRGCFWGESQGARLQLGGKSIPGYSESGGAAPSETDQLMALWSILYTDPWYELRLLRNMPVTGHTPFGQEPPSVLLRRAVEEYVPSTALKAQLAEAELDAYFEDALSALRRASEFQQAAATAPADPLEHRRAIARAVVAYAIIAAEEAGQPPVSGAIRDAIVERLTNELHGFGLGVGEFLLRPFKGLAQRMITNKLTGDRGSISDAAAPTAGDILRFLAKGDMVREFIGQSISDVKDGPVVLVGHSLGGIMCVDLLIRRSIPQVSTLVTVGSQAPFLYEIGALPSLEPPEPLPQHFPAWLNIYDHRDILSYVGASVLGDRITDVRVDNGQPFPQAHSAYWSNPKLWDEVSRVLPR